MINIRLIPDQSKGQQQIIFSYRFNKVTNLNTKKKWVSFKMRAKISSNKVIARAVWKDTSGLETKLPISNPNSKT
jgi:hypothetical protein